MVEKLAIKASADPRHSHSLYTGEGDNRWTLFYCPQTEHYYAINQASAECIQSSISSIHPAWRIHPETGEPLISAGGKPRLFAAKVFTGNKLQNQEMAKNETEGLKENEFADLTCSAKGQPVIIMNYHPGEPLCLTNGEPNHKLLKPLSLAQRFSLIFQISDQYSDIQKKNRLHVDVKGANIVVHVAEDGTVSARVIDFGSSRKLSEIQDSVETGLMGLTPYAIPPEAVENNDKAYLPAAENIISGFLNTRSDIYGLGPVFALILGATNPYQYRQERIIAPNNFFSMQLLAKQIHAGFNFTGLLNAGIKKFAFGIHVGERACGFRNFSKKEAPNDKSILQLNLPEFCYLLYQDQLLYTDKTKVFGRKNTKPRSFRASVENILPIKSTNTLTPHDLQMCRRIVNFHSHDEKQLDDILQPLIGIFLEQMVSKDYRQRPAIAEVLRFFTIINRWDWVTSKENGFSRSAIEQQIHIDLLQLNLIIFKAWKIESIAHFDFNQLKEEEALFEQFCQLLSREEILNETEQLTENHFQFLTRHLENTMNESVSGRNIF